MTDWEPTGKTEFYEDFQTGQRVLKRHERRAIRDAEDKVQGYQYRWRVVT